MKYALGIDIGSTATKAVIMTSEGKIAASAVVSIGTGTAGPKKALMEVLDKAGLDRDQITWTTATGYGRFSLEGADDQKSELSCHAKGVSYLMPGTHTIIDIGGQDIKVMSINDRGGLVNFVMNDKCAAGTGRFLDTMARVLNVEVTDLSDLSEKADEVAEISSTCTVFAESEVISKLSTNIKIENIVAGIHQSVAKRVTSLLKRCGIKETIAMSGGVALNKGLVKALENEAGCKIHVHEECQLAGALGAALYAMENTKKAS